ncbi:hypothetical protein B0H17DRAFT_1205574 [Mycena rosella]|uniref:Uncharacterized protein n=1 Tax=Mycena rosella TaxID=1033263 RepID=A0AAD7D6R5_MYCRO|nr:hypothetical protein B0H17DRAFT_1205574 [Mycena rosella]
MAPPSYYPPPIFAQASSGGFSGLALPTSSSTTQASSAKPTSTKPTSAHTSLQSGQSFVEHYPGLALPGSGSQPLLRATPIAGGHPTVPTPTQGASASKQPSTLPSTLPVPPPAKVHAPKHATGTSLLKPALIEAAQQADAASFLPFQPEGQGKPPRQRKKNPDAVMPPPQGEGPPPATAAPSNEGTTKPSRKQRKKDKKIASPTPTSVVPPPRGEKRARDNDEATDDGPTTSRKRTAFAKQNPGPASNMSVFKLDPPPVNANYEYTGASASGSQSQNPPSVRQPGVLRMLPGVQQDLQAAVCPIREPVYQSDVSQQQQQASPPSVPHGIPASDAQLALSRTYSVPEVPRILCQVSSDTLRDVPQTVYRNGDVSLYNCVHGPANTPISPDDCPRWLLKFFTGEGLVDLQNAEGPCFWGNWLYDPATFQYWVLRITRYLPDGPSAALATSSQESFPVGPSAAQDFSSEAAYYAHREQPAPAPQTDVRPIPLAAFPSGLPQGAYYDEYAPIPAPDEPLEEYAAAPFAPGHFYEAPPPPSDAPTQAPPATYKEPEYFDSTNHGLAEFASQSGMPIQAAPETSAQTSEGYPPYGHFYDAPAPQTFGGYDAVSSFYDDGHDDSLFTNQELHNLSYAPQVYYSY